MYIFKGLIAAHLRTLALLVVFLAAALSPTHSQYNNDYFLWIGRQELIHSNYQGAIRTINTLLRIDAKSYEGYFLRGIAKYNLNDLLGADADFTEAIELNPVYTNAYTYRAITRSRLGNYNDALEDFREAIDLRPDLPEPYYSRAITRLLNGSFKDAIEDLDQFILYEKRVPDAYLNRGVAYLSLQDTTSAYRDFNRAIQTNREDADGYNRRGSLFLTQNRFQEAESDLDLAIKYDSMHLYALFNRALLYNETKRPTLSLKDLDRVISIDSTNSISYFNRAIVRSQIGDYNRALEDYNKVAEYSPGNVLVYFYRANLLSQLGEIEDAEQDYTSAIKLYPDFANAYLFRSNLRSLMGNNEGAERDRAIGERKIEDHKAKLVDSTYSIYSDSTYRFDRLLSFDTDLKGSRFGKIGTKGEDDMELIPLYKFNFAVVDSISGDGRAGRYYAARMNSFIADIDIKEITVSHRPSALSTDSLTAIDRDIVEQSTKESWQNYFKRGVSQSLIRQYTSSINLLTKAIKLNASNPFIYFERATVRAEMIDFISSIDNSYQRITVDSDPANRLNNAPKILYNYDEAIADLDQAAALYPDWAYIYYNRAGLLALSGRLPEAYDDYTKAISLHPSFAEAYYNRGVIQIQLNDVNKGWIDISKAGELGVERAYEILKGANVGR
ncbi:MAG: tetratricopeptide repeat protein [Rikenellaceae bacterium]